MDDRAVPWNNNTLGRVPEPLCSCPLPSTHPYVVCLARASPGRHGQVPANATLLLPDIQASSFHPRTSLLFHWSNCRELTAQSFLRHHRPDRQTTIHASRNASLYGL